MFTSSSKQLRLFTISSVLLEDGCSAIIEPGSQVALELTYITTTQ